mmetsp:Transcript_12309/g.45603  ORF Transcript_12309/g.45603 Transcript_12309/m.45603 type:complete len:207 (-) Transcript_12309:184-804(-)
MVPAQARKGHDQVRRRLLLWKGRRHLRDERLLHVHAGDVHDPAGADLLHDCRMAEREPELGRLPWQGAWRHESDGSCRGLRPSVNHGDMGVPRPQRPARHGKQWRARFGQPLRRSCGADELALRRPVERHVWTRSARRWHLGGDHLQLGGGSAGQLPGRRKGQPFRRAGGPQRRRGHSEGEEHQRRERRVEHSEAKGCGGKRINAD